MERTILHENALAACKERGLRLKDVAASLGMTYQALYCTLSGNPRLSSVERIAAALGVEAWELLRPDGRDGG